MYDLIVVGGGIGGSALATVMALAGKSVLLLEQSTVYQDRVRGEWIAPWGVAEVQQLGLYDLLMAAGGHHIGRHVTYDESRAPAEAEAVGLPLNMFKPGVPGPLCLRHPHHCQTLFDEAARAGAEALRGVSLVDVTTGAHPRVTYEIDDRTVEATARLLVGADGRTSQVREAGRIVLHQDRPHHWFAGLLVDGAEGWDEDLQAIGTEGDFGFLAFPQGGGRVRIYGGYPLEQSQRFKGPDGPRRVLDAFAMTCCPANRHLVAGQPAAPLLSYFNNDSWTDERFASDLLKANDDWATLSFASYAEERAERMRRLRFVASLQATIDMEFGDQAKARRRSLFERSATDPSLGAHGFAVLAGPESLPAEIFTDDHRARVLGA